MNKFTFDSQLTIGPNLPCFTPDEIKNQPMLFSCDKYMAYQLGGALTKRFIELLPDRFLESPDLIIDSRVHMLMPGWYPAIPGFHHDDVPRDRQDGQPDYITTSYKAEHCMALVGDCCPTEFAIGKAEFPDVPIGSKFYKIWHPLVIQKLNSGELKSFKCPSEKLIFFDWQTWHQGTAAIGNGWRWFIRATINTKRKPANELRRQVQVYLENPMEGW